MAITNTSLSLDASASGGADTGGPGGAATGGTVRVSASNGGTLNAPVATALNAFALGGSGSGTGGSALGGNIFVDLGDNAYDFGSGTAGIVLDASFTGGAVTDGPSGTAASAGGVRITDLGDFTLAAPVTLGSNTPLYVQAGGSIAVPGSITDSSSGAYLHLLADDLGTGTGTVTLANGTVNLPGGLVDIYYNPASLGTPTDFSAGIAAGTATAYQLVNNVDQLQLVGSYLTQNFALGRNIDASATQGWNNGAGFVPIGTFENAYTGNFDGLNHAITNLYIHAPSGPSEPVGLFGQFGAGTGASLVLRNVGLVDAEITGQYYVGALLGSGSNDNGNPDNLAISNSYSTGGAVSGISNIGGLIGALTTGFGGTLRNVHSDAPVFATGAGLGVAGGLIGSAAMVDITDAFATGTVTVAAGGHAVGGLIGELDGGALTGAYATGGVAAPGGSQIGGLVGAVGGGEITAMLSRVYATGNVTSGGGSGVGGLVGYNGSGQISESYASGSVLRLIRDECRWVDRDKRVGLCHQLLLGYLFHGPDEWLRRKHRYDHQSERRHQRSSGRRRLCLFPIVLQQFHERRLGLRQQDDPAGRHVGNAGGVFRRGACRQRASGAADRFQHGRQLCADPEYRHARHWRDQRYLGTGRVHAAGRRERRPAADRDLVRHGTHPVQPDDRHHQLRVCRDRAGPGQPGGRSRTWAWPTSPSRQSRPTRSARSPGSIRG